MPRPRRSLEPGLTYHVTVRCNNRGFLLHDPRIAGVYVHANPKTAGVVADPARWRRSDYRHYLAIEEEPLTTIHPAFGALGRSDRARRRRYRRAVERDRAKSAPSGPDARSWGRRRFPRIAPPCRAPRGSRSWAAGRRQLAFAWARYSIPRDGERDDSLAPLVRAPARGRAPLSCSSISSME